MPELTASDLAKEQSECEVVSAHLHASQSRSFCRCSEGGSVRDTISTNKPRLQALLFESLIYLLLMAHHDH